jgi:LytS/YehU family sensor histidine kinase
LSAAALEAELTGAKLDTLRSQLRPHFLFNTLNAIPIFVTEDADKAQQMILRLSSLLRRSLDEEAHEVPLKHELDFVNDYLDIQRGRFGDRLNVQLAVDPAWSTPAFQSSIAASGERDRARQSTASARRRAARRS